MNEKELEEMRNSYKPENLANIENIRINGFLPIEQLFEECIKQVENVYHVRSGNVEIEFFYNENTTQTVKDSLRDYFLREK